MPGVENNVDLFQVVISGWGTTSAGGSQPTHLQKVSRTFPLVVGTYVEEELISGKC